MHKFFSSRISEAPQDPPADPPGDDGEGEGEGGEGSDEE
jgi:hypothetical protein